MLLFKYQLQLLDAGYGHEALELEDIVSRWMSDPRGIPEVSGAEGIETVKSYTW